MNARRVPAARSILRAAIIGVTVAAALGSTAEAAKPAPSSTVLGPRFGIVDWTRCDNGGRTAVCTATSSVSPAGNARADAALRPEELVATGHALGWGGPLSSHKLSSPVAAIRYRFVFEDVSATASTTPELARDLSARGILEGRVWHSNCTGCTTTAYRTVVDGNTFSLTPESVAGQSQVVEAEVRNPDGLVPAGTLRAAGLFLADVGPYDNQPNFTSSAAASIEGRLSRIEVSFVSS